MKFLRGKIGWTVSGNFPAITTVLGNFSYFRSFSDFVLVRKIVGLDEMKRSSLAPTPLAVVGGGSVQTPAALFRPPLGVKNMFSLHF